MSVTAKTGESHLAALRDNRTVYVDGHMVRDVTLAPEFRNVTRSAARLYDFQAAPENVEAMTFVSPTNGKRVSRAWQIPKNHAEMVERRKALVAWAELHGGFMGRSPDHLASALAGQVHGIDVFEAYDPKYANNLRAYFEYVRDADAFLTYTIINPQGDRAKAPSEQGHVDDDLVMRVVDEDSTGLTVRGAKMMGTSSIMANEIFVANLQPLKADETKFAVSFALPMNTAGLRVLSRKSFEAHATTEFDNPLAWHFDENDALVYFDDVKVPWDRVFVNQNPDMCRKQFHETAGHVFQNYQAQIRLMVKLRFLVGIARKIAETIGTVALPPVQATLGKLASEAAIVEGMVLGMEAGGYESKGGWMPNRHLLYASQVYTQELYPSFINTIRELAGGALIMLPSSAADFANPDMARWIGITQASPVAKPTEKVKFLKLAWDALGSEFAGRHLQYEMFYAGAQFVTRGHSYRTYDWVQADGLVNGLLDRYELAGSLPAQPLRAIA